MTSPRPPAGLDPSSTAGYRAAIVVPCFNEADRLDRGAFEAYARQHPDVAFILVNDGSTDRTLDLLRSLADACGPRVHALDLQPNRGKAEAVRAGILEAFALNPSYVGYWDADLATPLEAIDEFADTLDRFTELDIVLGARVALLGRNIERKASRHYLGRVFATAASLTLGLAVYDTQCGAKMFRNGRGLEHLFATPFGSRWIFDVEILARYMEKLDDATRFEGVYELPLRSWRDVGESKVEPIDFVRAIGELLQIYRRYPLQRPHRRYIRPLTAPFIRYGVAGGVGTAAHFATLMALVEAASVPPGWAAVAGAGVGALINYALNYHFTFSSHLPHRRTLPRFLVVAGIGMWLNGAGVALGVAAGLHYLLAQLACTLMVLVGGFVANRFWSFSAPSE